MKKIDSKSFLMITVGSIIFAASVNLFIVPFHLYNGGIIGTAQIIRTLLVDYLNLKVNFDIAGIINFILNIPLLLIAYRFFNGQFVIKTVYSVIIQTLTFSIIPILEVPLVQDQLSSIIIGSICAAYGCAMVLVQKACAGGNDITGMLLTAKNPKISVGKFNLQYNIALYILCALLFDIQTSIYSILHATIFSFVVDKQHLQNIEVSVMIFTKNIEVKNMIIKEQKRGVTYWKGIGAYTSSETEVLVTVVSKYELNELRQKVQKLDPQAFIIISKQLEVSGGYEKRLV